MKKNRFFILIFLVTSVLSVAQSGPAPENAPADYAQRSGPPPPPPAPIDDYIVFFLFLAIVFVFLFFINNKKNLQD